MRKANAVNLTALILLLILVSACGDAPETQQEAPPTTTVTQPTSSPEATAEDSVDATVQGTVLAVGGVVTRTPAPTSTPGVITQGVQEFTDSLGLAQSTFLTLRPEDWINLGISVLMVIVGYLVGALLIRRGAAALGRRADAASHIRILETIAGEIRWLVVLFTLNFAIERLDFVSAAWKVISADLIFLAGLAIVIRAVFNAIAVAEEDYRARAAEEGREDQLVPVIVLVSRGVKLVIIYVMLAIGLSRFGINVLAFSAALGLGGLALSLAAQDTIADAIAGFIILIDRPFRIGDRIEIEGEDTWGDVADIGLRTTKIRTRDNRMVIVPNSTISENLVINYTYPDPQYRISANIEIAYGTDIETVRTLIVETVRTVDGVLPDRPVDALYDEMGDWAMVFRVRWWIETYADTRRIIDQVHTALQHVIDDAGIESPYPIQTMNLVIGDATSERLSRALQNGKHMHERDG